MSRKLDSSVVTGSKKSVTKLKNWMIYITVCYPYKPLCISANGSILLDFFGQEVSRLFDVKLHYQPVCYCHKYKFMADVFALLLLLVF